MEIVQEVTLKARGGQGGFGAADESDNLEDMNYAERLVLNKEFLTAIGTLKTAVKEGDVIKGGAVMLTKEDILQYRNGEEIEMNGVAHKVNQVFVALEVPFYATSYSTDAAEKVTRTKKRGENIGKEYKVTLPDRLRVYRISDTFSIDNYAAKESKRVKDDGVNDYNEPTTGMRLREEKWVEENGDELKTVLKAINLNIG